MATPPFSCSTDAHSNTVNAGSDDEVDQSSMWIQQEDNNSSDLPPDFLEPLSPGVEAISPLPPFSNNTTKQEQQKSTQETRQFWKSGDFTGFQDGASFATQGMDHARVHPKFLHSNATSHKWVLGAIAELLDNAVDEIRNGATFAKVDVQKNPRNGEPMLVIEDDGGGMDPECMRRCMSLGYSAKSKISNTIGQYGNGFKTSTMRLGADVIVFSRYGGSKPSQSIGMMSYTFLASTGQNDIIVPIVDFQMEAFGLRKLIRSNVDDWMESIEAIENWSPYSSQEELVSQFNSMLCRQGTKIVIYNLWEDEEGRLELDFIADPHDIQTRSTTRDEKIVKLAASHASCRHYLTYNHSLQTYISILYLRLPVKFRIFLRGKQVQHHCLRDEMMLVEQVTYRPKDAGNAKAVVTIGFVKDAAEHIDVSGFNVYHKNRLIKPFWRIWNPSDTRGRGIIAILEANFVEPAHDKQSFERTTVLTRLEARLIEMQRTYWNKHCHKIGYNNPTIKKTVRPPAKDNKSPASGGAKSSPACHKATKHVEAMLPVIEREVAEVHDGGVTSDMSHVRGVSPTVMTQAKGDSFSNSSIHDVQEPNVVPGFINFVANDVGNSNGTMLHRQDSLHVQPECIHTAQHVQGPSLPSVRTDLETSFTPISSDVSCTHVPSTCLSSVDFNLPDLCPAGMAPVIIDLDSPDADEKLEDVAFEVPFPQSSEVKKEIVDVESGYLSGARNTCEASLRGDGMVWSPKVNDSEGLADPSLGSFPSGDMKAFPRCAGLESCYADDATGMDQVEASLKEHDMESLCQSEHLVLNGCLAAPITVVRDGQEDEDEYLRNVVPENIHVEISNPSRSSITYSEQGCLAAPITVVRDGQKEEHETLGNIVPENSIMEIPSFRRFSNTCSEEGYMAAPIRVLKDGHKHEHESLGHAEPENDLVKIPSSHRSFSTCSEEGCLAAPITIVRDGHETLGNAVPENGMVEIPSSHRSSNTCSEQGCLAAPITVGMVDKIYEQERLGNAVAENGNVEVPSSSRSSTTCYEPQIPTAMDLDAFFDSLASPYEVSTHTPLSIKETETLTQVHNPEVDMIESSITQNATTDNACMPFSASLEELRGNKSTVNNGRSERASKEHGNRDISNFEAFSKDALKYCNTAQTDMDAVMIDAEGKKGNESSRPKENFVNYDEKPTLAVMKQPSIKGLAVVPYVGIDHKDSFCSIQASSKDIICIPTVTSVEVATAVDIASISCVDLMEEDRLVLAKQQINYLQESIQAVVVEVDDLREQLEQHHELQHLELRNLNMELERALSRLEELKG